jgi:hypothetical protein
MALARAVVIAAECDEAHRLEAAQMLLEVAVGRLLKRQQSAVKCPVIGGYSGANVLTTRNPTL